MAKLNVLAKGALCVPHFESLGRSTAVRYIGRAWDAESASWVPTGKPETVPTIPEKSKGHAEMLAEYAREVREGSLLAADEETAKLCGVAFADPDDHKAEALTPGSHDHAEFYGAR